MDREAATKERKWEGKGIRVTLKRSPIGTPQRHRLVLRSLGLRRLQQSVIHPDTPQVRGMIRKVSYLVEVGEV